MTKAKHIPRPLLVTADDWVPYGHELEEQRDALLEACELALPYLDDDGRANGNVKVLPRQPLHGQCALCRPMTVYQLNHPHALRFVIVAGNQVTVVPVGLAFEFPAYRGVN